MATAEQRRERLVARQVAARGVRDPLILAATKAVRRKLSGPQNHGSLHLDHQRQP
jgi:hypothetical protein